MIIYCRLFNVVYVCYSYGNINIFILYDDVIKWFLMNFIYKIMIFIGIYFVFYDIIFIFILWRDVVIKEIFSFVYNNILLYNLCMYDWFLVFMYFMIK